MKIYVAGKFEEKEAVREAQQKLRALGHEITHDWTQEDASHLERGSPEWNAYMRKCAQEDFRGVDSADAFLLLNHPNGFGAMTEFGIALSVEGPDWIGVVGAGLRDNIFFHLNCVKHFNTVEEAVAALDLWWRDAG